MSKNFNQRVWELLKKIPRGRVTTYKELGRKLGSQAYRAVGNACNKNPYAPVAACHRVVNSDGSIGGFAGGMHKKISMLQKEGVRIKNKKIVDFEKIFYRFR
jgi:methylated-DNA-[protein]-cysteine S-methyltransferase